MSVVMRAKSVAVSLTVVAVVTAILWYLKLTPFSVRDPVFFYVLPVIVVALIYGSVPALLGACAAFVCADYFLYDPLYSLDISSRVEFGDLACFTLLALLGVKCVGELFRPTAKPRKSRVISNPERRRGYPESINRLWVAGKSAPWK